MCGNLGKICGNLRKIAVIADVLFGSLSAKMFCTHQKFACSYTYARNDPLKNNMGPA